MKHATVLLLSVFSILFAGAQEFESMNMGGATSENYFTVIPYEYSGGLPIIKVEIAGKEYRFLLDTGAATSIRRELVEELQPEILGSIPVRDSEAAVDTLSICSMPGISVGGVIFEGIPACIIKDVEFVRCLEIDGIIGSNLLRESIVRFSDAESSITITDMPEKLDLHLKEEYASELFLEPFQSLPFIWTLIEDKENARAEVIFDSGMTGMFDISLEHLRLFEENNIFSDSISVAMGSSTHGFYGKTGDTVQCRLRVNHLWINNAVLKNVLLTSTSNNNSRIGINCLEYGDVTVDYKNNMFFYEPYSDEVPDLYEEQIPVSLNLYEGKLVIGIIWDAALSDKISVGDQVLAINGVVFGDMSECELFTYDIDMWKDSNMFRIKDKQGNIKEILIEKK